MARTGLPSCIAFRAVHPGCGVGSPAKTSWHFLPATSASFAPTVASMCPFIQTISMSFVRTRRPIASDSTIAFVSFSTGPLMRSPPPGMVRHSSSYFSILASPQRRSS